MVRIVQTLFQRRYLLLQVIAVGFWLIIEIAGYGTGALQALLHRPLTNTGGIRLNDLIAGAPPPGPHRLTKAERDAQAQRITTAFGSAAPKHDTLPGLRHLYQPKSGFCDWRADNVAGDVFACNDLKNATPLFLALLRHVHPKTETLFLREVAGPKGDRVTYAFFIGSSGRPQILLDVSRVSDTSWDLGRGFVLKAWSGSGLGEIALGAPADGNRLFVIDDPGSLPRRDPGCAGPGCFARLLLYAYEPGTTDSLGKPVTGNLADVLIDEALEQRFRLFAAVLGKPVAGEVAQLDTSYKPEKFAVTTWHMAHLRPKLDAAMGARPADRALFSPFGWHVAFGTVYGFALDGRLHLVWEGVTPHHSLGTDAFVFRLEQGASSLLLPITGKARGVYVLRLPNAPGAGRLVVHKATQPTGKPWSEFEAFGELFAALTGTPMR